MEIQRCRKEGYFKCGFLDPYIINEKTLERSSGKTEENIYKFLMKQHFKEYILLPYDTK